MENVDMLLDVARQRTVADEHCNICLHQQSKKESCGHIIETCHHPKLDADGKAPEVDGSMVCDWYEPEYPKAKHDDPPF